MFDQYGATEEQASEGPQNYGGTGFGPGGASFDPSEMFRNIFTGGGFDIFGNGGFGQPNLDVTVSMTLSFLEAAKGAAKTINFSRLEVCSSCSGKGVAKGGKMVSCRSCKGTGQETKVKGSFLFSSTCKSCGGMGKINPDPCTSCNGSGSIKRPVSVQVDIPPGVSDGEVFSVRREGNKMAGQAGDLIVSVTVERSDIFVRKKNDIYVNVPVSLYQALMGGTIVVPTINGDVEMKIPPGTQPDDVKRMSGRGIFNATTREQGSQYVKVKVDIPRNLTTEQQDLLERCFKPNRSTDKAHMDGEAKNDDQKTTSPQWLDRLRDWLKWY
jgi:molecular chaperone DnaJ